MRNGGCLKTIRNYPTLASNPENQYTESTVRPNLAGRGILETENPGVAKTKSKKQPLGTKHTLRGAFAETGVQVVGDLVEDVRGDQSALLVHEPDLNMPRSLRETFDLRWLISAVWQESPSQPMCLM